MKDVFWLLSASIMFVSFVHVVVCSSLYPFLLSCNALLMNKPQSIHPLHWWWTLGFFRLFLEIRNNGAVNICVYFLWVCIYRFVVYIFKEENCQVIYNVCICSAVKWFSKIVTPLYTASILLLLNIFINTYFCLLNFSHFGVCVALLFLICFSGINNEVEYLFIGFLNIFFYD